MTTDFYSSPTTTSRIEQHKAFCWCAAWPAVWRIMDRNARDTGHMDKYHTLPSLDKELRDTCQAAKATPPNLAQRGNVWSALAQNCVSPCSNWPSYTWRDIYKKVPCPSTGSGNPQEPQSAATATQTWRLVLMIKRWVKVVGFGTAHCNRDPVVVTCWWYKQRLWIMTVAGQFRSHVQLPGI